MTTFSRLSKIVALASVSTVALTACGGSAGGDDGGGDGEVTLRFSWWGSDSRHETTQKIIKAFEEEHPNIDIKGEYGDWAGYWDQLATQTAANDAPDIMQMDVKYLREYADRGALLDLSGVDTSTFDESIVENGTTEDGLFGITTGINSLAIVANPELFKQAGVKMPDDTTWTWEDYAEISAQLSENLPEGSYGASQPNEPGAFQVWLRQQGKHLTTQEGELGFEAADAAEYLSYWKDRVDEGGLPPASVISENQTTGPDQALMGQGEAALASWWTNQLSALSGASGVDLELLRFPSETGKAEDNGLWYKSSMMMSVSAGTEHPEEAQTFVDFFVNSEQSGKLNLVDRGLPANEDVREAVMPELDGAAKRSAKFVESIGSELGETEPVPAPGFSALQDIMFRYENEVFFGRLSPEEAAEQMVAEMESEMS